MVTSLVAGALARLLPAGFRDRQRAEWLGDLAQLDGRSRARYLLTAFLTLPSLYLVARSAPGTHGGWAVALPRRVRGYPLIAAFTLVTALFGAAVAGRLAWDPPPPLLSAAGSQALQETVFPGLVVTGSPDAPAFEQDADGDWRSGGALFTVSSMPVDRELRADTVAARDRLAEAGWTIDEDVHSVLVPGGVDSRPTDAAWGFTAHTGGLLLEFGASRYSDRTSGRYDVRHTTYPHAPTMLLLAAGMVAGAAGWLAACSLYRRVGARRGRAAVRVSAPTVVLFALVPAAFLLVARELAAPLAEEVWPPAWYSLFVLGGERPYVYAALTTIFAVWVALLPTIHAPVKPPHWEYAD
ncbi:hypothetical protein DMB66_43830 [Actinoplanes sp. ATCC 53533]|uniref:hypothetical protein n=1 Tax=Actinoplanes sp. ATCC 53533 TaxID=1288362 RepID=UPI000F7B42F0|nr:hypothetical protein [Actinoplanes sp. ATCC 53533]RSM49979.1 hypothetical protein DMB66_43830 [Actinoplanes sp. ATCC 53533]